MTPSPDETSALASHPVRRSAAALAPVLALALAVSFVAPAVSAEIVHTLEQTFYPGESHTLEIDLALGSLVVEGTDQRDVKVEVRFECEREDLEKCRSRAHSLYLKPRVRRGVLHIDLKGTTKRRLQGVIAHLRIETPRHLGLEVDVRAGSVSVGGMTSHIEIDSPSGDVAIVHHRDRVRSVKASVGIGKADLWVGEGHIEARGFPRSLSWSGSGQAEIEIDVGSGDISIRLE